MKNNRLTCAEIISIREAVKEIHSLASMENCAFRDNETVKLRDLQLWLQWFDSYACRIDRVIGLNIDD